MAFKRATIETYAYPTEDPSKVRKALLSLIPEHLREEVKLRHEKLRGQFGYSIEKYTITVRGRKKATEVARRIIQSLPKKDLEQLLERIDLHMDGGTLYIRVSKQKALEGVIELEEGGDIIRVVLEGSSKRAVINAITRGAHRDEQNERCPDRIIRRKL
ncbi:MAG: hypothetical protein DRN99_01910 [Thermoproteota archaeon]|nr:MAG: hypothetical protein DRN99_01910 [Candidatus Korarchaeota archaeon]